MQNLRRHILSSLICATTPDDYEIRLLIIDVPFFIFGNQYIATSSSSESHSSPSSPSVNNLGPPPFSGPPQKRCFIGVAASAEQIVTIGKGAERTWVRQLTPYCDVRCVDFCFVLCQHEIKDLVYLPLRSYI